MSDSFSSENAESVEPSDYESLEDYIFETQRDKDNEVSKAIRFREWQDLQLRIIKNKIGTNIVEIVARSYLMGLARLREDHHEDVDDLGDLLADFLIVIGKDPRNEEAVDGLKETMNNLEVEDPEKGKGNLTDPKRVQVRESALSEVENNYVHGTFFGGWIHRYVASLGFLDSEFVSGITQDNLSSLSSSVSNSMDEARDSIESLVQDYISVSQGYWIQEGMDKEIYEGLEDVVELMETERKDTCERLLQRSQDFLQQNTEVNDDQSNDTNGQS